MLYNSIKTHDEITYNSVYQLGYTDSTYDISKSNFNRRQRSTTKTAVAAAGHSSEKGWDIKVTMPQAAEYIITSGLNLSEHGDHSE